MRHSVIPSVTIYSLLPVKSGITDAPHETPKAHTMFMCVCVFSIQHKKGSILFALQIMGCYNNEGEAFFHRMQSYHYHKTCVKKVPSIYK